MQCDRQLKDNTPFPYDLGIYILEHKLNMSVYLLWVHTHLA